jgi:hypothetical protein
MIRLERNKPRLNPGHTASPVAIAAVEHLVFQQHDVLVLPMRPNVGNQIVEFRPLDQRDRFASG